MSLAIKKNPTGNLISNLLRLMQSRNISEAELARRTGTPQPTLHKILSGKTGDPRCSTLKALADFFNISIDEMLTDHAIKTINQLNFAIQSIPIISWKDCLTGVTGIKALNTTNWDKWAVCETTAKHVYGVSSKPSTEPRFPRGTLLFIDAELPAGDGDIVVVHFPETEEATLRELSIDGPIKLLHSLSNTTETTRMTDTIKIHGVLIRSAFEYI